MAKFGVTLKVDGGMALEVLCKAAEAHPLSIKVASIVPDFGGEPAPKETAVSVNGLFSGLSRPKSTARRAKAVRKSHERTEGGGRSVQIVFDMIKDKDGIHWTDVRDKLAKQGYAEGTGSARLNELKSKYHLVEHRDDGLYYLTKRGQKTKIVP